MGKTKVNLDSLISVELKKFEQKLEQFQKYLELNDFLTQPDGLRFDDTDVTGEDQEIRHKEILIQIKMQDAVLSWLPLLEKLKQGEEGKGLETRGDIEPGSNFKRKAEK